MDKELTRIADELLHRIGAKVETDDKVGKFTVYGTVEKPLVLAKDVAKWIDNPNPSQMVQTVDDDEKLVYTLYISGQNRDCLFLTEDGVYEVLFQSRKPIAKAFKKEVKRILKELREKGIAVTKRFASQDVDEQIRKCLQACAIATEQIEKLNMTNRLLSEERDDALETVKEKEAQIKWIDKQRMDMSDVVCKCAPLKDAPSENAKLVRSYWKDECQKAEGEFDKSQNSRYVSMIRRAISRLVMYDYELEEFRTVMKADEIKGTKHTKDECMLLELYNAGKIRIATTLIGE